MQWIQGHSDIPGNDSANRAFEATELRPSADLPIAFSSALNVIKNVIRDPAIAHDQAREIYTNYGPLISNVQIAAWEDEALKARLRSGHHSALRGYLHRLDPDIDPGCSICKDEDLTPCIIG